MPQITYTSTANSDLVRIAEFLEKVAPESIPEIMGELLVKIDNLRHFPEMGRVSKIATMRELPIAFGKNGYLVLYRYDNIEEIIAITAIKHSRELHFSIE